LHTSQRGSAAIQNSRFEIQERVTKTIIGKNPGAPRRNSRIVVQEAAKGGVVIFAPGFA
jgi:hypothetical protein